MGWADRGGAGEPETTGGMLGTPEEEPISQSTDAPTFSLRGHYLLIQRGSGSRSGKAIYNF